MELIIISVLLSSGVVIEELRQEVPTDHTTLESCEEWAQDLTQITLDKFAKDFKDQPELVLKYEAFCQDSPNGQ